MLITILSTAIALAAPDARSQPPPSPPQTVKQLLDAACVDAPNGACAPLYEALKTLRAALGEVAAEFCCGSCGSGVGKSRTTCTDCAEKGGWKCGLFRHAKRNILASCGDPYTLDTESGTLSCY
jgi:hypothetical protein